MTFRGNQATRDTADCDGGGALFIGGGSVARISNSTFADNQANNGGAINSLRSNLTITGTAFSNNRALHTRTIDARGDCGGGGAVYIDGARQPEWGGPTPGVLSNNTFSGNSTNNFGGAIFVGLYRNETLVVDRSTFTQNVATDSLSADDPSGTSGAIWYGQAGGDAIAPLVVTGSTFIGNRSEGQGGGIWVAAPLTLTNTTFYENLTVDPDFAPGSNDEWQRGNGGALAVNNAAAVTITNVTFARNRAGFNGGAIAGGRTVSVRNTLFANNTADWSIQIMQHCTEALTDAGGNVQFPPRNPSPFFFNETNCTNAITIADAAPQPPADNGGPTQTMALAAGSPAINAGVSTGCPARDQRDRTRTGSCDVGAYEFDAGTFVASHYRYVPLGGR